MAKQIRNFLQIDGKEKDTTIGDERLNINC